MRAGIYRSILRDRTQHESAPRRGEPTAAADALDLAVHGLSSASIAVSPSVVSPVADLAEAAPEGPATKTALRRWHPPIIIIAEPLPFAALDCQASGSCWSK